MTAPAISPTSAASAPAPTTPGLQDLRDIHLPTPVGAWPPAPGWWMLAALALIGIVAFAWWLKRRAQRRRYRKTALQQLDMFYRQWQQDRDDIVFAQAANRLLKQTALAAFPAHEVAALNGADWLDFLDRRLRKPRFTEPDVRALATLYVREPEPIAVDALRNAARDWIRRHRC